jgi:hypothetical protein
MHFDVIKSDCACAINLTIPKSKQGPCTKIKLEFPIDMQRVARAIGLRWHGALNASLLVVLPCSLQGRASFQWSGEWAAELPLHYCSSAAFPSPGLTLCWRSIWKVYSTYTVFMEVECAANVPQSMSSNSNPPWASFAHKRFGKSIWNSFKKETKCFLPNWYQDAV